MNSFLVNFQGSERDLVAKATAAAQQTGGVLGGGAFVVPTPLGKVTGTFAIVGQTVTVTILDKPLLLPMGTLEAKVKKFFESA